MTWIQTNSGNPFNYLYPRESIIDIDDIATGLSTLVRFGGHSNLYIRWTVAQHSLMMAEVAPEEHKLACLLHDAPEAYMSDIPAPLKQLLPEYRMMEENVMSAILEAFGVVVDDWTYVKSLDKEACAWEALQLQGPEKGKWAAATPITHSFPNLTYEEPIEAKKQFIEKYNELIAFQNNRSLREAAIR